MRHLPSTREGMKSRAVLLDPMRTAGRPKTGNPTATVSQAYHLLARESDGARVRKRQLEQGFLYGFGTLFLLDSLAPFDILVWVITKILLHGPLRQR